MVNPLIYFFATCALMSVALWKYYSSKKKEFPELKLQFRIIDFWATMIGTAPSMLLLAAVKKAADQDESADAMFRAFCVLFPCQLAGCVFGIISNEVLGETSQQKPAHAVLNVIGGGIFGLLGAPAALAALVVVVSIFEAVMWISKTDALILMALAIGLIRGFRAIQNELDRRARQKKDATTPDAAGPSSPGACSSNVPSGDSHS